MQHPHEIYISPKFNPKVIDFVAKNKKTTLHNIEKSYNNNNIYGKKNFDKIPDDLKKIFEYLDY